MTVLLRGSTHGADCMTCPYSHNGEPLRPVVAEYPEHPKWILVGESPGRTEVQLNRPFMGSQGLVEKMLTKIGRRREEIVLTTAILCSAPVRGDGAMASDIDRERAASACSGRLREELAQWPGMPVLTLGAVAARAVIPKPALDAIDPPNVPKSKKRSQKERQRAEAKALKRTLKLEAAVVEKRRKEIEKIAKDLLKGLVEYQRNVLRTEAMRPARGTSRPRKKPSKAWLDHEMGRFLPALQRKANADAIVRWDLMITERELQATFEEANPKPVKPKKKKVAKITDIMSTCFEVDVDGSGVRPVIPSIHPGSLLRGGGATIGGTHTPDLAFVNLYYDAGKIDSLAQGKDIRLKLNVDTEVADKERTGWMVREALDRALAEGEVSIDLETYVDDIERHHALMAYMARIRTIGLATNDQTISVMWEHIPAWALSYLQLVLGHPQVTKTFHNCLTGDSRVWLSDGRKVRLETLVREKYDGDVLCVNETTGAIEKRKVLDWIKGPVRPWADWKRIRVRGKGCLRLTVDHEVLTTRGRVQAKDICVGDQILTSKPTLLSSQKSLIYGSLLGDASISMGGLNRPKSQGRRRTPFFHVAHAQASQEAYALFKAKVLEGLLGKVAIRKNGRGFSAGLDNHLVHVSTKGDARLLDVWEKCTRQHQKRITSEWIAELTPAALAIWYCDDGTLTSGTGAAICVEAFRDRGVELLVKHLQAIGWPVKLKPRQPDNKLYLYITGGRSLGRQRGLSEEMVTFWESLAPYIPECMSYKLPERFQHLIDARLWESSAQATAWSDEVVEVGPLLRPEDSTKCYGGYTAKRPGLAQFCLVVDGNRNFFAEGLAVSNCLYDTTVLAANGYTIAGPIEDTLLGHHAAFPGCAHRLQTVTAQFFAVSPWKSEFRNSEETPEGLTKYNAIDTGATHALRPAMTLWIKRTKTEKIYALDKKMAEIASKMHLAGMPVSRERNSELLKTFTHNVHESRQAVEAIADQPSLRKELYHFLALQQAVKPRKNDPNEWTKADGEKVTGTEARYEKRLEEILKDTSWKWKIGASKHIAALIQAMGQSLLQKTDSGQTSTKKDVLESLAHLGIVRDILTFRENDKLRSTFVWQIFDRFDKYGQQIQWGYADDDDRIHPIWTIHKITGRWASQEPVVSNVPKDRWKTVDAEKAASLIWLPSADGLKFSSVDEHGVPWKKDERGRISFQSRPNLRSQIVAPPGRMFVGFDFAQLEARVIALISGDPFLCATFAEGKDIHTECARVVFPTFDTLSKDDRKQARDVTKNFEYGAFYGGSIETLWRTLLKAGYTLKLVDVARAVAVLMNKMVGVVRWQRETVANAQLPPYEVCDFLLNRRRTFPLGQVEATEAMNFGVQSAGSAIMNTGMAIADEGLRNYKQTFAIAQIHDAAVFECWEDDCERLAGDVNTWFHQSYERDGRTVPFPVDVKIAKSWANV